MTITKEMPQEVLDRPDTKLLERRPLPMPEEPKAKGRRWFPWIASLVVVGIAATALVVYLVGGREGTVTYETSFNYELAEMMAVEPAAAAGAINTIGATYDPLFGSVVFPNAPTAAEKMQALADSLIVDLAQPAPVNTIGATYDPVAGTVVFPNN